ncbi:MULTISPECIES: hypothetical protein [Rhodopirellula]|uniref:hypothetical protein n=1 Tax=Rhodopirellula TaxID=265488 RepID=UPI00257E11E9|nr:hypothetical protein [Rhodopirellula sp. UBA1907]
MTIQRNRTTKPSQKKSTISRRGRLIDKPFRLTSNSPNVADALPSYSTTDTADDPVRGGSNPHWVVESIAITWASFGFASLGLIAIGSFALTGSLWSLASDEDAYIGLIAVPVVVGFACVGAFVGFYFRSLSIGATTCFFPLLMFASLLWLSDYFGDLGEGEQVAMLYANGLFIGGISMFPAFIRLPHIPPISSLAVPHALVCLAGLYFLFTFGL